MYADDTISRFTTSGESISISVMWDKTVLYPFRQWLYRAEDILNSDLETIAGISTQHFVMLNLHKSALTIFSNKKKIGGTWKYI